MSLPTSMQVTARQSFTRSGITVGIYPSTKKGLTVELQSATASAAASSLWQSVILPPSSAQVMRHTVTLGLSTRSYYFKARHPAQAGYSAGAFTPTISAKPVLMPEIQRPFSPLMTYAGNVEIPSGSDVFVSSAKTVRVGTQPTTALLTKPLVVPYAELLPQTTGDNYALAAGYIYPTQNSVTRTFYGPVVLPPGVTIKTVAARMYRTGAGGAAQTNLKKANSTAGESNVATCATTATAAWQTVSQSVTEPVTGNDQYYLVVALFSTAAQGARFMRAEIGYQMPSYDKGY